MKTVIENMSSADNWTADAGATIEVAYEPWFNASYNESHLRAVFSAPGAYIEHAPESPLDVSDYDFLQLSVKGNPSNSDTATEPGDIEIRAIFTGALKSDPETPGVEIVYLVPFYPGVLPQVRFVNEFETLERIRFTSVSDDEIAIRASDLIAFTDEFPIDIYRALEVNYARLLLEYAQSRLVAGTITAAAGATSITLNNPRWVDRLMAIEFNGERHVIENIQARGTSAVIEFNGYLDGASVLSDASDAVAHVHFPVLTEPGEDRAIISAIALDSAMNREIDGGRSYAGRTADSHKPDGKGNLANNQTAHVHLVAVSADTRHGKDMEYASRAISEGFRQKLWINGRAEDIREQDPEELQDFGDATNILPRIMTVVRVSARPAAIGTQKVFGVPPSINAGVLQ